LAAVTHFLKDPKLKNTEIRTFYKKNALVLRDKIISSDSIEVTAEEHPSICGGVTEYLTKIRLAKRLKIDLVNLNFFDDINKEQYQNLNAEELAFAMYEPDISFRCGMGYTPDIFVHKRLIIEKAKILGDIALRLID